MVGRQAAERERGDPHLALARAARIMPANASRSPCSAHRSEDVSLEKKNMAGVIVKDVVKVYENGVRVVDRFNMDIKDREFVVLVGPSGCGQSTTPRLIAGLR